MTEPCTPDQYLKRKKEYEESRKVTVKVPSGSEFLIRKLDIVDMLRLVGQYRKEGIVDAVKEAQADKQKALNPDQEIKQPNDDDALTEKVFDMLMDPKEEDFRKEVVIFCSINPKVSKRADSRELLCIDDLDSSDIYIIYVQCMKFSRAGLDLKKEI